MGILDKSGSSHAMNGGTFILRFLQLAFGAIVVGRGLLFDGRTRDVYTGYCF
jgi:hypothetical protein